MKNVIKDPLEKEKKRAIRKINLTFALRMVEIIFKPKYWGIYRLLNHSRRIAIHTVKSVYVAPPADLFFNSGEAKRQEGL